VNIAWEAALPAPAKVNLFLHVVGRRPDGYHLLQTVFRFVDRSDTLRFERRADREIRLARPLPGVPEAADLVVRAARLLQAAAPGADRPGVTIHVEKRIPMGGGLGGGSSDAATTLLALDHLWGLELGRARLAEIGLALGADVPVFVAGRNAWAEGVGEVLTPVDLPPAWYVILTPQVSVPTKEIFSDPALTRDTPRTTIAAFFAGHQGRNDLLPVVSRRHPEVARHLAWLAGFGPARMSGSGSSVFLEVPTEREARAVAAKLPSDLTGFVARGLDRHPLT
jgi:4-diphosphocytidyl-2-C-methyl-D-erythritol kinase